MSSSFKNIGRKTGLKTLLSGILLLAGMELASAAAFQVSLQAPPETPTFLKEDMNPLSRFVLKQQDSYQNYLSSGREIIPVPYIYINKHNKHLTSDQLFQIPLQLSEIYAYSFTRAP